MTFKPSTDVVQEVLNAADPSRASLAAQRLDALASSNPPDAGFSAALDNAAAQTGVNAIPTGSAAYARSRLAGMGGGPNKLDQAKTQFEAMVLNSFVGEMLPKDAGNVFGQGTAGDMWRSMLAEQVSMQIAKSGSLGLARRLFATHELAPRDSERLGQSAKTASDTAQMSANMLSAPISAEFDNGAVLFAGRKRA